MTDPAKSEIKVCCLTDTAYQVFNGLNGRDKKRLITVVLLLAMTAKEPSSWISVPIPESASALYIEYVITAQKTVVTLVEHVVFCG